MRKNLALCLLAITSLAVNLAAQASAQEGESSPQIGPLPVQVIVAAIDAKVLEFVQSKEIAGAVTCVASSDTILHLSTVGERDLEDHQPMTIDSIFWIASMTKPITGAAVAKLASEGKLTIDDPVSKYLPEFSQLKLPANDNEEAKPAAVTIKHLLTHTAGLSELTGAESNAMTQLTELTQLVATKPLKFVPGTKWTYSQTGINTAARIVEVISGQSFPDYLDQNFFKPLGMVDTTFYLTETQVPRLAKTYRRTEAGELEVAELGILGGKSPTSRDRLPLANGGLFSTASDYTRFCQMLLNNGNYAGRAVLKPEAVRLMAQVHSGELVTGFTPGNAWGLGICIVRQPQGVTAMLSPGTVGHGGAYGTQAWIDPVRDRIYVLMVQRANFPNSDASPVRAAFQQAAVDIEN